MRKAPNRDFLERRVFQWRRTGRIDDQRLSLEIEREDAACQKVVSEQPDYLHRSALSGSVAQRDLAQRDPAQCHVSDLHGRDANVAAFGR